MLFLDGDNTVRGLKASGLAPKSGQIFSIGQQGRKGIGNLEMSERSRIFPIKKK